MYLCMFECYKCESIGIKHKILFQLITVTERNTALASFGLCLKSYINGISGHNKYRPLKL